MNERVQELLEEMLSKNDYKVEINYSDDSYYDDRYGDRYDDRYSDRYDDYSDSRYSDI